MDDRDTPNSNLRRALIAGLALAFGDAGLDAAAASQINLNETQITLPDAIEWKPWGKNVPAEIGGTAVLYGGTDMPGPYLVLIKWNPGWMSAPHSYRTDRLSLVLSGTWWVNSGPDFDPAHSVPVPPGSFVRRVARTPHCDGVMPGHDAVPAVVALFGMGPVDMQLVDPAQQAFRKVG